MSTITMRKTYLIFLFLLGTTALVSRGQTIGIPLDINPAATGSGATFTTWFQKNLAVGSRGREVVELQNFLRRERLFTATSTGFYGTATRTAVRAFQKREGVTPQNGVFGPQTRQTLFVLLRRRSLDTLLAGLKTLQQKTASDAVSASSSAALSPASELPPEKSIPPQSIVGLNCYFKNTVTGEVFDYAKGSGVIINKQGIILTVRHLVDMNYVAQASPGSVDGELASVSVLDHCDAGQISATSELPSPSLIAAWNPSIQLPVLAYTAVADYFPTDAAASAFEGVRLDFALLKITGITADGAVFGYKALPAEFPSIPLLKANLLKQGDDVVTYGYPGYVTRAKKSAFNTMYLTGSVGKVRRIFLGDARFADIPFLVNTTMEVREGRSGSPLFWRGYVAGVISAYTEGDVTDSYSVSSAAIYDMVKDRIGGD